MSELVGNPEDRFSHNEAHILCEFLPGMNSPRFLPISISKHTHIAGVQYTTLFLEVEVDGVLKVEQELVGILLYVTEIFVMPGVHWVEKVLD